MESESSQSLFSPGATKAQGKVFVALLVIALAAALAAVPSEIDSLSAIEGDVTWWAPFIAFLVWAVPSASAVAIGVILGAKVGLGAPLVRGWIVGEPDMSRRLRSCLLPSLLAGIVVSVVLQILGTWAEKRFWPALPENALKAVETVTHIAPWKMILASFAGGVCEELVFRFGLMTLIVWLGIKLVRCQRPGRSLLWTANLLAAVPFALVHLVNAASLGIPITFGLIISILVLNGVAGLVFGWLYARHGIEAAMLAHFVLDFAQFVIRPMVS
ncbi:MAG TPA: CPBP family intramembrane glutamic endopeptidase [Gemmataceae bacterium]|jgi:hypothetical protein|nr:CPBP family intramembrane glutamic endopeptidase [Gemmataceae bacterium]